MNKRVIVYVLGAVLLIEAALMLLPLLVAVIYREKNGWYFLWVLLGAAVLGAAQYYLVFSLVLALGLVLVVALRDLLKKGCLAFCGLFNDTLKLDGMMFFWSLINTFKDLGRIKIGRLVVNTVLMWAAYLGSYTALAAALTAAGQPMALVDVFDLLFGRNAADLSALLPGGAMGAAAPAARILLLCWFALPLLAMWLVTLLPEKVRGAVNQATQAAPAGESYLNFTKSVSYMLRTSISILLVQWFRKKK